MNQRAIPYAVGDLEEIVRDRYFFIDKRRFIPELDKHKSTVPPRPRSRSSARDGGQT